MDGCGDPGKDIAIEVTPSARNGAYPQDFAVENLKATQTLQLYPPSEFHGALVRDQDSGGALPYLRRQTPAPRGAEREGFGIHDLRRLRIVDPGGA